jgi:two-component system KDP operon response regulator KdpE
MIGVQTAHGETVLVIDDEEQIRRALHSILAARGYEVSLAASGEEGIDSATRVAPDLVVLDLTLPGISGLDVCRRLRRWYAGPILVLSVRDSDDDKVLALDLGADDYLTKPFSAPELLARVRALLRRAGAPPVGPGAITVGRLSLHLAQRRVSAEGVELHLTRTEFDILAYLVTNTGRVLTSRAILTHVWGPEYAEDAATLRVHVSHLRRKIEPEPSVPRYILTEPGVGFRFSVPE